MFLFTKLSANQRSVTRTLGKLATGDAINRASDGPAGLIASEDFAAALSANQARIASLGRAESVMNIRDGALGSQLDNIADLDGLVVQAGNEGGLAGAQRRAITTQVGGVLSGIERVLPATGIDIMRDVTTQMRVGADEATGEAIYETVSLSDLSRVIGTDPEAAGRLVDGARDAVLQERARVGADQRAAEHERRALEEEQINTAAVYSRTRDADYAKESSALIRSQILGRASIYTILAARVSDSTLMRLLDVRA